MFDKANKKLEPQLETLISCGFLCGNESLWYGQEHSLFGECEPCEHYKYCNPVNLSDMTQV